jgi:DNA-binding response OmpR family regulator
MRILVVEDEERLRGILLRGLKAEGFVVDGVSTVQNALEHVKASSYDLVILDLKLPDGSGTMLLRHIRQLRQKVPVLILTASAGIDSKIENFQAGADDYLTKPFALAELTIRVQALLRRKPPAPDSILRMDDLSLNQRTRQVCRAGKRVELSPREYALLEYLFLNAGRTVSRAMILEKIWDHSFEGLTNIVDVHIGHLRHKIDDGFEVKLIRTVRGMGYSLYSQKK